MFIEVKGGGTAEEDLLGEARELFIEILLPF
jgi:predicted RNA-binding protein